MLSKLRMCLVAALVTTSISAMAQTSSEYYEKALAAFEQQDIEAAYIQLKNSLQQNEDNLPAKILMGKVLLISGYLQEAEEVLEEALTMGADPSLIVDTLGKVWLFTEQNDKILESSFSGLSKQAQTDWQIIVATANLNLNNFDGARLGYTKALANDPSNVRTINALALLELRQERFEQAKKQLDKSFILDGNNANTWRLLGDYHLRQKQLDQAIEGFKKSYQIAPDDPLTKRSLVTAYLQNQDVEAARALLEDILEQTPGDPTGMLLKAWLLAKNQMSDEAANELENLSAQLAGMSGEAMREDPSLIYVSGLSAFALQNYNQAKTHFIQYLTFVPENSEAAALLAQTHIKLNEPKPALEVIQRHERKMLQNIDTALLLADLYLANDKAFKAVEIISQLKDEFPNDPSVELLDIKAYMSRGKYKLAEDLLNQSSHSNTVRFAVVRAQMMMETGRIQSANEVADQLLEVAPSNIDFLNLKAAILIRLKNYADAENLLDKALELNAEHFNARFNKANLLSSTGQTADALEIAEALNEVQPDSVPVLTLLARNQYNAQLIEPAVDNLKRVLEKDIDNLTALELLSAIYTQQGDFDRAVRQLNIAIKVQPENPMYQMQRAELYLELKQVDRAKRELAKIKQLVKSDPVGLVELSKIQFKASEYDEAINSILTAYQMMPDSLFLAKEYIRTLIATGDLDEADKITKQWLEKRPNEPQLIVLSGDIFLASNDTANAAQQYAKALQVASNYRVALAKFYQVASNGAAAELFESRVSELVEQNPDDHFQRNLLADFYVNQGRLSDALPHYQALLDVDELPNRAFVLNNLANIYVSTDLAKAEQFINQALQQEVEAAALYDTQGWIKSLQGKHEEALTILRKAFAMNSDDPSNQYHLAYTLHKLGRNSEAKMSLNRALSSTTTFNERTAAESLLTEIE